MIDRFVSQYYPDKDIPEDAVPTTSPDALDQIHTRLRQANEPLRNAGQSPQDRDKLRGKSGPLLTTMLAAAARGLAKCPDFAQQIGIPAQALDELTNQRLATSGDIKTQEIIVQRADNCWYAVTGAAQKDAQKVFAAVQQAVGPEPTRTAAQIAIGGYFEAPLRLNQKGLAQKQAVTDDIAQKQQGADAQVEQSQDRMTKQQQVQRMLTDFQNGKGPLQALPPAPAHGKTHTQTTDNPS
jgi:hypothetical protein